MLCNYLFPTCAAGAPDDLEKGLSGISITPIPSVGVLIPPTIRITPIPAVGVGPPDLITIIEEIASVGIEDKTTVITPARQAFLL